MNFVTFNRRCIALEEKVQIANVFQHCHEGKGFLDREDIKVAIINLFGYKPSKYEVEQLMGTDEKGFPGLSEEKFKSLMEAKLSLEDLSQEQRQIFNMLDIHCKGFITVEDFRIGFSSIAPHISTAVITSCFELLDKDGDGRISYRDFSNCVRTLGVVYCNHELIQLSCRRDSEATQACSSEQDGRIQESRASSSELKIPQCPQECEIPVFHIDGVS